MDVPKGPKFGIVGTRRASPEGRDIAEHFGSELGKNGVTIVSGLAFGIDLSCHSGALNGNGKAVAVLASSVLDVSPRSNEWLAKKILEKGGAIISEYPIGSRPLAYKFLMRNRIVAGLCKGILVIEAPQRSGSLATARFALEADRDVFVVPGSIYNRNYEGSNRLIRDGATLVTEPKQILEAYGLDASSNQNELGLTYDTPEEKQILDALKTSQEPIDIDKITGLTKLSTQLVNETVSFLVIKGVIKEKANGYSL